MEINSSRTVLNSVQGRNYVQISITIEQEGTDYHDAMMECLLRCTNYLYGGHYEPKSERDRVLADKLLNFIQQHNAVTAITAK